MSEFVIRQPATEAEVEAFFQLAWTVFHSADAPESYPFWRDRYFRAPGFQTWQMIGAYADGEHVGGCLLHRRTLELGPASLLTGCVGAVHVHPDHRKRGIAGAVLREAERQARERGYALLLLDGIPGLYRQFGYVDVFDPTIHALSREAAAGARGGEEYIVRPATPDDAADVLALYGRHFPRLGRFERDLVKQGHLIRSLRSSRALRLAVDPDGAVRGYLQPSLHDPHVGARAGEVAADDWPAVAALLREHARLAGEAPEPPAELLWPLPTESLAYQHLADNTPLRSESRIRPDQGWMARVGSGRALWEAVLPLIFDRWSCIALATMERVYGPAVREVAALLRIGLRFGDGPDDGGYLLIDKGGVLGGSLACAESEPATRWVTIPSSAFLPLIFGYRSVAWAAAQPGAEVPSDLLPILDVLFLREPFWIPGTDAF